MASTAATVSLRAAAKALGMPPTSLARLLESEPTLAAAVIQQPGPRRAMAIQLELLQAAWAGAYLIVAVQAHRHRRPAGAQTVRPAG